MSGDFELNTAVSNPRDLAASDLSSYDAVYLGNPFCRLYEDNYLEDPKALGEGIARVRDLGLRPYVTTYAAPRNRDLDQIRRGLEAAARAGADAIEAHNLGVIRIARKEFPTLAVHAGGFANVYTDLGAEVLGEYGVRRITPNYELSLEEIAEIRDRAGVPVEILVHGKIPLGVSHYCFLLEHAEPAGVECPALCQQDFFLTKGDWAMKSVGKGILSGRDVCMLEHLPRLWAAGHRAFRVETISEGPAYRREIGRVYREAIRRAAEGGYGVAEGWWGPIRAHSAMGLCNGFYFGLSGRDYVGTASAAAGKPS